MTIWRAAGSSECCSGIARSTPIGHEFTTRPLLDSFSGDFHLQGCGGFGMIVSPIGKESASITWIASRGTSTWLRVGVQDLGLWGVGVGFWGDGCHGDTGQGLGDRVEG